MYNQSKFKIKDNLSKFSFVFFFFFLFNFLNFTHISELKLDHDHRLTLRLWAGWWPVCACAFHTCTCCLCAQRKSALLSSDALQGNPVSGVTISGAVIYHPTVVRAPPNSGVTFGWLGLCVWTMQKYGAGVCIRRPCASPRVCRWGVELEGRPAW